MTDTGKPRNKLIYELRSEQKLDFTDIAGRFGISKNRARQIYNIEKEKIENPEKPGNRLLKVIQAQTGLENPSLIDIQTFLRKLNEEPVYGWEFGFLKLKNSGRKLLFEMRAFASKNGILPPPKLSPTGSKLGNIFEDHALDQLCLYSKLFIRSYTKKEKPNLKDFKEMILKLEKESEDKGWKHSFYQAEYANQRTYHEFKRIVEQFDILPKVENK